MQTFNQSLAELVIKGDITQDTAMSYSSNQDELRELINRGAGVPTARAQAASPAGAPAGMGGRNPNIKYS
jgi:twitching motility protein PilT